MDSVTIMYEDSICHAERLLQEVAYSRENIVGCFGAINKKWYTDGNPIATMLLVKNTARNAKTDKEAFFAKSIHAMPNWKACPLDLPSLDNILEKAEWLISTLTNKKTGKNYRLIDDPDDRNTFLLWATLSASIRTLTWRYEQHRFVDQEAGARIGRILAFRQEKEMLAEGAGHARKHEEDAQLALAPIIEGFSNRITDTFFPPYVRELPPLPQGIALPVDPVIKRLTGRE